MIAGPRPASVRIAGWIPRASSRSSWMASFSSAAASSAAAIASSFRAGGLEARSQQPERERQRDEPLLGAVVEVALEPAPFLVGRLDDPRP